MAAAMNSTCCLDPKTRIPVSVERLIKAIERAKKEYASDFEKKKKAYERDIESFKKKNAVFLRKVREHCGRVLNRFDYSNEIKGSPYSGVRWDEFFGRLGESPPEAPEKPNQKQLERAITAYDLALEELRMCPKETVSISIEDFRRYMEKC